MRSGFVWGAVYGACDVFSSFYCVTASGISGSFKGSFGGARGVISGFVSGPLNGVTRVKSCFDLRSGYGGRDLVSSSHEDSGFFVFWKQQNIDLSLIHI